MKRYLFFLLCISLLGCAGDVRLVSRAPDLEQSQRFSQKLQQLDDSYFEEYLQLFPVFATSIGDHRYDDRLGDAFSEQHRQRQQVLYAKYLGELQGLQREALGDQDRLSYDLLKQNLALGLEGLRFDQHLILVRQLSSTPIEFPLLGSGRGMHPFRTVQDYDNFLSRIRGFQVWVDTAIANMRIGVETGIVQPKIVMERTLPQLEAMMVTDVKESIFYQPIRQMPTAFSEADKIRLAQAYAQAIAERIIPTYRKLHAFIKDEYLPKCRVTVGLSDLPGGRQWYAHLVKVHTTTALTPEEIFQLGVNEINRIEQELDRVKAESGFVGNRSDFVKYLAKNSGPAHSTKEDLIKGYEEIRAKVTPRLAKLFGHLPKAPYEIRPIEEFRERSAPSQYWSPTPDGSRPGIFYVNASGIRERPRWPSLTLFLHEAVPGHHFQIALQRERENLPRFRRFGSYTAFSEGWALYAEGLGQEMGLYTESGRYYSFLSSHLFRAVRLVVDVGLHHEGWSREQALKFMMEKTLTSESGAALEIDRYIAWPGQALAYKIGQLKIFDIRAKAEKVLGSKFDIRAFHDELLKDGAMPLDLLEVKMDAWIENQKQ